MKKFSEFLLEDDVQVVSTTRELEADLCEPENCDELNTTLRQVTASGFTTPFAGLTRVSKTLATYGIILPQVHYLPEPKGEEVFKVQQYGVHPGYTHTFVPDGKGNIT